MFMTRAKTRGPQWQAWRHDVQHSVPLCSTVVSMPSAALTALQVSLFNCSTLGTTRVSRYQKGKTNLDFTEARDSEWQYRQLDHMQVCISLQTDNHAIYPPLKFFYRPDALPAAQPTASKH